MRPNQTLGFEEIHCFLAGLFNGGPHAKRVLSLSNATLGVIMTASLAVSIIGQGLALARGLITRHAIKQVDRLLSNEGIDIDAALRHWVPYVVGSRTDIRVAMDWTDFDADGQTTIMLSLMTRHGRATPLAWLTVAADTLKNNCNEYERLAKLSEHARECRSRTTTWNRNLLISSHSHRIWRRATSLRSFQASR
jgi:hypothetical protein